MRRGEPAEGSKRHRVVSSEDERYLTCGRGVRHEGRDARARLLDLRQEARPLILQGSGLGFGALDIAEIPHLVAEAPSRSSRPAARIAEGPMSTPRRPCPRSSAAPMIAMGRFWLLFTARTLTWSAATLRCRGEVAQLVEHTAENRGVAGSSPALATREADPHSVHCRSGGFSVHRDRGVRTGRGGRAHRRNTRFWSTPQRLHSARNSRAAHASRRRGDLRRRNRARQAVHDR